MPDELSKIPKELIEKAEKSGYQIGDYLVDRQNSWFRVSGFDQDQHEDLLILAEACFNYSYERTIKYTPNQLHQYNFIKSPLTPEEAEKKAIEAIQNPAKFNKLGQDQEEVETDVTALVVSSGKDQMLAYRAELDEAQNEIEIIKRAIEAKVSHLKHYASQMRSYIKKMDKVLGIFELYLGVNEEIVQLAEGIPTPSNTPISLRQLILYMDEEVGDPTDGGIDWTRVEDFDNWLLENDNYKKILPEPKGVVGLRPSRRKRWQYGRFTGQPFLAVQEEDYRFYLLIRNGENLYRIFTSVNTGPYMFPTKDLIESILKRIDDKNIWGSDKENLEDTQLTLARNALILKGLMERTPIFQPMDRIPNIEDTEDPLINFIHDAEFLLPPSRKPYKIWKEELNNQIDVGSRVLVSRVDRNYYDDPRDRFVKYYAGKYNTPDYPEPGVYQVERILPDLDYRKGRLVILYNPGGTVYSGWDDYDGHERKNRVSFILYRDEEFVFNYDLLDLADVEFYLENRLDRENYYNMIPLLWELKKQRLAEIEYEKHLVELICGQMDVSQDQVWETVKWWKTKNKWKRPIRKDDAKALRMIKRRLKKVA